MVFENLGPPPFKCYVDHSHTRYSSGNIDVQNWVPLFESPCITCSASHVREIKIRFLWSNLFIHIPDFILCSSTGDEFDLQQNGILHPTVYIRCRSQRPRGIKREFRVSRLLELRVRIPPAAWKSVSWECCKVRVSLTGWSLVQRSPTDVVRLTVIEEPHRGDVVD